METLLHKTPYLLHSVSVVVTAEFHNPSILNPDFLVSREIVPSDWVVTEAVTTPPVSIVRYDNGIQWTVDQSNLTVTELCESPFRDNYHVYGLVNAYLSKLPHVPYRSLGLNCVASTRQERPAKWLIQRFLKLGTWLEGEPKVIGLEPSFVMDAGDATCNLSLREGWVQSSDDGDQESAVIASVNMHHAGPLDADGLTEAINQWSRRQRFVISALDKLLRQTQA